jgi:predicted MPP superfamily phosphohydrolase
VGLPQIGFLLDTYGIPVCLLGIAGQVFAAHRLRIPARVNYVLAVTLAIAFCLFNEGLLLGGRQGQRSELLGEWMPGLVQVWCFFCIAVGTLLLLADRLPRFNASRRDFLRVSTAAACSVPAAVFGAGIVTRKDFRVNELDIQFPNLPPDLHGLRLLQISDIHMSAFFSRNDLARVVDACNELKPDLAFITGDLITAERDPLDECLVELGRLRSATGVWGCMGNHEMYAGVQTYTKAKAMEYDMDFLRYESRLLKFGKSHLNVIGMDYHDWEDSIETIGELVAPGAFNLLLAHTPQVFRGSFGKGFQLTLSGHTHGGQINLELMGTNFNVVDFETKYTKGLYREHGSTIYVNSGLGTIGVPIRIGAPPEITVIRLCNS